nr:stage II sporulation protein D [uncultured Bacillus sp.]
MKKIKPIMLLAVVLITVTLVVPSILVLPFNEKKVGGMVVENQQKPQAEEAAVEPPVEVAVYRATKEVVENIPLEQYVAGVVASEMPADFEKEALKAQALTARTYIVKQMMNEEKMKLPKGAIVADTELYQVYKGEDELKRIWGSDYSWKIERITEAVAETSGQILTYNGSPIDATFFSTSNGYTESSEAIWSNSVPYLKSVASPWDKNSPKFSGQKTFTVKEFESLLAVKLPGGSAIGTVTERTTGKRVAKVEINGKIVTGKEIREKLGLMSTDFTWERKGDNVVIHTKGYGHGVGMSQYGANGMAKEGKSYSEIAQYYYQGSEVSGADTLMATIMAKK